MWCPREQYSFEHEQTRVRVVTAQKKRTQVMGFFAIIAWTVSFSTTILPDFYNNVYLQICAERQTVAIISESAAVIVPDVSDFDEYPSGAGQADLYAPPDKPPPRPSSWRRSFIPQIPHPYYGKAHNLLRKDEPRRRQTYFCKLADSNPQA